MKQTTIELLIEQIKSKADNLPTNTKESRMAKGVYVDCLLMTRQAKEIENKQQGYSEEDMKLSFEAGHKKGFSGFPNTENWKELPFEEWFEKFKNK